MKSYRLISILLNPIVEPMLRSPFRSLLSKRWVVMTYTGRRTHKKRSVIFHMARYKDEFVVVPGCFAFLPNWWRNFREESMVDLFTRGEIMKCFARAIEDDEANAAPDRSVCPGFPCGTRWNSAETTEEMFNKLVTAAAKTYPIVAIRPDLNED